MVLERTLSQHTQQHPRQRHSHELLLANGSEAVGVPHALVMRTVLFKGVSGSVGTVGSIRGGFGESLPLQSCLPTPVQRNGAPIVPVTARTCSRDAECRGHQTANTLSRFLSSSLSSRRQGVSAAHLNLYRRWLVGRGDASRSLESRVTHARH